MHQTLFYVSHEGEELGPLSLEDVHEALQDNRLTENDYIYVEEHEDWILLATFLAEEQDSKTPVAHLPEDLRKSKQSDAQDFVEILPEELRSPSYLDEDDSYESKSSTDSEMPEVDVNPSQFLLKSGVTDLLLEELRPGTVELHIRLDDHPASVREEFHVQGGRPHCLNVRMDGSWKASDPKKISLEVCDKFGEPCSDYKGTLKFRLDSDPVSELSIEAGTCTIDLNCTKAGEHCLRVIEVNPALEHPSECLFSVQPDEPVSLKVHSEGSPKAGEALRFKIQAYDAHGNLATTYNGPLNINILERPKTARDPQDPALKISTSKKTG